MHRHTHTHERAFTRVHIEWTRTADAAAKPVEYCFVATFAVAGCCEEETAVSMEIQCVPVHAMHHAMCQQKKKNTEQKSLHQNNKKHCRSTKEKIYQYILREQTQKKNRIRFILNKI